MYKNVFFFLPDSVYLKWRFKLIMGYKLDLDNPQTFNEKLQWLKLYDHNPKYTMMVDKYKVKEYVRELIGELSKIEDKSQRVVIECIGNHKVYDASEIVGVYAPKDDNCKEYGAAILISNV